MSLSFSSSLYQSINKKFKKDRWDLNSTDPNNNVKTGVIIIPLWSLYCIQFQIFQFKNVLGIFWMISNSNLPYISGVSFVKRHCLLSDFTLYLSHLISCAHVEGRSVEPYYVYLFWKERGQTLR